MKNFSHLTAPQKLLEGLCLALLVGMILSLVLFWGSIPDQIPGHYNAAGEIDRWGSKWELLLLPFCGVFLYAILSAACAALWSPIRKGEIPRSTYTWLAGTKLVIVGTFAFLEWCGASARPAGRWLLPVDTALLAALMTGFLVSALRFAIKRGEKQGFL